jgi:hypothetical protein
MAVPADKKVLNQGSPDSEVDTLRKQLNNLVASFRLLTAKLDADAGVTDANYNALITDDAVATAPAKVELVS